MLDLSAKGLTDNVIAINSNTGDKRQKLVMEALIRHLHAFAREVALTTERVEVSHPQNGQSTELISRRNATEFLTKTGQTCSDIRQEFILLSDVFGLSAVVVILNHPKPEVGRRNLRVSPTDRSRVRLNPLFWGRSSSKMPKRWPRWSFQRAKIRQPFPSCNTDPRLQISLGELNASEGKGEPMLVRGRVTNTKAGQGVTVPLP